MGRVGQGGGWMGGSRERGRDGDGEMGGRRHGGMTGGGKGGREGGVMGERRRVRETVRMMGGRGSRVEEVQGGVKVVWLREKDGGGRY